MRFIKFLLDVLSNNDKTNKFNIIENSRLDKIINNIKNLKTTTE